VTVHGACRKSTLEAELVQAWAEGGAKRVSDVLDRCAPKGWVVSPMPTEAIDVDIALFGRMVASEPGATVDAALSMSHSMTVGEFQIESDYFTAREEHHRRRDDQVAHIGLSFWGAGIHYRYAEIHMGLLRRNLEIGGRTPDQAAELAEKALRAVLSSLAVSVPGGKSTNSAPFAPASYVMLERGSAPSANMAVAFSSPIPSDSADMVAAAVERLRAWKAAMSRAYGSGDVVEVCACPGIMLEGACPSVSAAVARIAR
jgi:CRISPR system Cascade subunit CasC